MSGAEPSMRTATCSRWTCCELVALSELLRQIHLALFCSWRILAFASDRRTAYTLAYPGQLAFRSGPARNAFPACSLLCGTVERVCDSCPLLLWWPMRIWCGA